MNEDTDILVLDRQHPEFDQSVFAIRSHVRQTDGAGFAKWVTSPERGRFTVYAPGLQGQALNFCDDEAALIELLKWIKQRYQELGKSNPGIGWLAAPDMQAALEAALTGRRSLQAK